MFHFEDGIVQVTTGRGERESSKGSHTHTANFKHKTCTCIVIRISILINNSTILRSKIRRPIRIVGRILMLVESYDPTQLQDLSGRIITRFYDLTIRSYKGSFKRKKISYNPDFTYVHICIYLNNYINMTKIQLFLDSHFKNDIKSIFKICLTHIFA